ncbi:MAG: hypothetical protein NTX25_05465, partial [Proteobacteria bacterium]|nr:hypothetical protein [Pseudomonadota bacterium]
RDSGQISIYNGANPVLIEAGTVAYSDELYATKTYYQTPKGHNILQADSKQSYSNDAVAVDVPLTVSSLNATQGKVKLDATKAFVNVKSWKREITWGAEPNGSYQFIINDVAALVAPRAINTEWFRFHTGAASVDDLIVTDAGNVWNVRFKNNAAIFKINGNKKIRVDLINCKDGSSDAKNHVCLLVKTTDEATDYFQLITRVFVTVAP